MEEDKQADLIQPLLQKTGKFLLEKPPQKKAKIMEELMKVEMSNKDEHKLDVRQLNSLFDKILNVEREKVPEMRLQSDEVVFIISKLLQTPRALPQNEDKLEVILREYQSLRVEAGETLQPRIRAELREAFLVYRQPVLYPPVVNKVKYQDILDYALTAATKTTLTGHTDSVNSIAISNDGSFIVSGAGDHTIKQWDIQARTVKNIFTGHTAAVISVAISADDKFIVSGSEDTKIMLSSIQDPKNPITFQGHVASVTAIALTSDGNFIVSGSRDKTLKIWQISNIELLSTLTGHTGSVRSVIISPDGRYILSASEDASIRVWEFQGRTENGVLNGHKDCVRCIVMTPDSKHIVSASEDKTIRIWDFESRQQISILIGHSSSVTSVVVDALGKFIITGSEEGGIFVDHAHKERECCGHVS